MGTYIANLGQFIGDLEREKNKIQRQIERDIKKLAFIIFKQIIKNTPVDKGTLRASWSIAIKAANDYISNYKGGSASDATRIAAENVKNIDSQGFADLYVIFNNQEYATYINDGSSRQAPKKFVEKAIADGIRMWENRKK